MGLVKFSPLVTAVQGRVGGSIFSRNVAGAYVKAFPRGTDANTASQRNQRTIFGAIAGAWRNLTAAERASWVAAATTRPYTNRLGEESFYSGQQLFMHYNMHLSSKNVGAVNALCPALVSFPILSIAAATATIIGDDCIEFLLTPTKVVVLASTENLTWLMFATPPHSPGAERPPKSWFRFIQKGTVFGVQANLTVAYCAIFGTGHVGQAVDIRMQVVDDTTGQTIIGDDVCLIVT